MPYQPPTPIQGPDFLRDFMAGFGIAQQKKRMAMDQQAFQADMERERFDREQRQEHLKLAKQEIDLRLKRAKQEDALKDFELRQQSQLPPGLPPPTAQDMGVQQAVPDVGPPVSQIQVPQPSVGIPSTMGGPDIQMPVLTGAQQQAMAQAAEQAKMRAAFGMKQTEYAAAEPFKVADDERAAKLAGQRDAAAAARAEAATTRAGAKKKGDAAALRKEYNNQLKPYLPQIDNYNKAEALAAKPPDARTAADDMSLVFIFMRSLDPGSTVREGEYATAKNTAGVPDKIRNAYNQALNGQFLTPQQRNDFAASIRRDFEAGPGKRAKIIQQRYEYLAKDAGIDPTTVLMDEGVLSDADSGGEWQTINGVKVREKRR